MKKWSNSFILKIAIIIIALFCIFLIINLQFKNNEIRNQIADMELIVNEASNRLEDLKRQVNSPFNEEYLIEQARKINYHLPSEIIFYSDY